MFIDHQVGYLDIVKLCDACCEAHVAELVATPGLEEIVHYDQWVRVCVCVCGWVGGRGGGGCTAREGGGRVCGAVYS